MQNNEQIIKKVDSLDPEGYYIFEIDIPPTLSTDVTRMLIKSLDKSLKEKLELKHYILLCVNDDMQFTVTKVKEEDLDEVINTLEKKVGNKE